VFAPSLSTFVRDVAGLKTPGRPVRQRIGSDNMDAMSDKDREVFLEIDSVDPEPSPGLSEHRPEVIPVWVEQMASNWSKVRANLNALVKGVTEGKETSREGLDLIDQELSSIANKIALLDTRIGVNPTASGMVSVWEAVEDVVLDGRMLETKLTNVEKRQIDVERVTKEMGAEKALFRSELDALLENFDALAENYSVSILKLQSKLVSLENDRRARLIKEASGPAPSSARHVSGIDHEAIHSRFELQIDKLKEDGGRLWRQLQDLQTSRNVEMTDYEQVGGVVLICVVVMSRQIPCSLGWWVGG
jgi:hypothetical protein